MDWVSAILSLAERLNAECGESSNVLRPVSAESKRAFEDLVLRNVIPARLSQIYTHCDGFSLMDLFNGISVVSVAELKKWLSADWVPKWVNERACVPFASSGGGHYFAILSEAGEIVRLTEVAVHDGHCTASGYQYTVVAADIAAFIGRVVEDLKAFSSGKPGHPYLTST